MSTVDSSLFLDIADALGISSPAIVEKDYWATQLLKEISQLTPEGFRLVFSGGTCLAKAHQNTFRMSEDIDIKMIANSATLALSKNQQRQLRRDIHQLILNIISNSGIFKLVAAPKKRNEGKYQQFLIEYPREHDTPDALRPHLQLDLTESDLLEDPIELSLSSLYASTLKEAGEVQNIACVTVHSTASEKFVSLLRRTASHARDNSRADDKTLIRHVYDLHLIYESMASPADLKLMVKRVIEIDKSQFGNQHEEFVNDAHSELRYGLSLLIEQEHHQARYDQFIGPLVYHPSPAKWDEAISSIQELADHWL
ncbi:nucleotidyl transferase AbiEii/AbiGii toxin family protein [Aestuariirhabdus haliotis]|uniref:nucleotidyl transferase AbiEii/AbiGii toxin family protein n=1 Tax=Aestuariirhabdus haliotis TaxID=2918751 RepID=UPI0020BE281A|nr:nucleotidyl transferase AbiEii/AbiGii toxin family protein [Aestuariirhabdus haliotis]MCL6419452.1 nucleotidyl transferase AbiEii/AbiGii toxin family protein [Aestuariirhabdus haliotis]